MQRPLSSPPILFLPEAQQLQLSLPGLKYHHVFQLVDLSWTLLCSRLAWEAQHWTQYSKCLTRADRKDHRPQLADYAFPNVFQKAVGILCQEGLFLARGQLFVHWDPSSFSAKFLVSPQYVLVLGVIPP